MPDARFAALKRAQRLEFQGRTRAYRRFREVSWRTAMLLEAGLVGIGESLKRQASILEKLAKFPKPRGPRPENHAQHIEVRRLSDGNVELEMDRRSAALLTKAMTRFSRVHKDLRFHHYAVLYTWNRRSSA